MQMTLCLTACKEHRSRYPLNKLGLHKRLNNMWFPGQRLLQITTVKPPIYNVFSFIWEEHNASHMIEPAADTQSFY